MSKGFDCATPLTLDVAKQFKTDGYDFVARYFPSGLAKSLTLDEARAITEAGLHIVSVFETTADRALVGYDAGKDDGARAAQTAQECGQPENTTIYFAVDFDVSDSQMQTVLDYIRGASEATPTYTTGVYGSYAVIEAAVNAGVCSHYWQTVAWSHGNQSVYANLFQFEINLTENGIGVDHNNSYGNEGWWNTMPVMSQETGQSLLAYCKFQYSVATNDADRQTWHNRAEEVRQAAGLPEDA